MNTVYCLKENCCGCSACYSVCSQKAIAMKEDEKGFRYPVIDETKCINCGMCRKVCRFSNKKENLEDLQRFFAIKHKDANIVKNSQSGGAFTIFSDWILEQKGTVYGAKLNTNNFSVSHNRASSKEERNVLRGSKYVQSDMNDCFASVAEDLKQEKFVFFTGTPCQIDGLLSYLYMKHINQEKLYTADLICHGVPSQKVFKSFIAWNEKKYMSAVVDFQFREKQKYAWGKHIEKITLKNGKNMYSDWFANIFYNDSSLRENCYNCPYTSSVRNSDLTIADFWGINKCLPEMYDSHGVSSLIVHTTKGLDLLEKIKSNVILAEVQYNDLVASQPLLHAPVKKPDNYDDFWKDYKELDFETFLKIQSFNTVTKRNQIKELVKKILKFPFRCAKKIFRNCAKLFTTNQNFSELSEIVCCKTEKSFYLKDDNHIKNYYHGEDNRFYGVFEKNKEYQIKPYSLCKYPVTQRLFENIMGFNPSSFKGIETSLFEMNDLRPVENVSWYDCVLFCNKLTENQFGKDNCVYVISNEKFDENAHLISASVKCDTSKHGYRLPSEMEWEFAARGGNTDASEFAFAYSGIQQKEHLEVYFKANDSEITTGTPKQDKNLDKIAWYSTMSESFVKRAIFKILRLLTKKNFYISGTHQVGKKKPNYLGLYDMSGNVWEWCYDETDLPPVHDATEIKERIMRGGGWPNFAYDCCISERYSLPPEWYQKEGFSDVGFRLCRSL